jgi:hypothetical protein
MKRKLFAAVLLSAGLVFGCGGEEEESVDVEGCEHLKEGPATAVTATATATGAPAVKADHSRYDVTLVDVTGGKGGTVTFAATEEGDYVLFTGTAVQVSVKDANGAAVGIEASATSSAECTEIKGRHTIPMKVGTHTLTFGPTPQATVSIVIEADHGDHEH